MGGVPDVGAGAVVIRAREWDIEGLDEQVAMRLVFALVDHVSGRGELEVRVPVRAGGRGGQGNPDGDALPHPERSEVAQQLPGHRARAGSRVLDGVDAGPALLGQKELRDVAGVRLWV